MCALLHYCHEGSWQIWSWRRVKKFWCNVIQYALKAQSLIVFISCSPNILFQLVYQPACMQVSLRKFERIWRQLLSWQSCKLVAVWTCHGHYGHYAHAQLAKSENINAFIFSPLLIVDHIFSDGHPGSKFSKICGVRVEFNFSILKIISFTRFG